MNIVEPIENTTEWAYWWNAPRQPVENHYQTYDEIHRKEKQLQALVSAQEILAQQPAVVRMHVMRIVNSLEAEQGSQRANAYLSKSFVERLLPRIKLVSERYQISEMTIDTAQLMYRFNRLPDMSASDIELLARDIAGFVHLELGVINDEMSDAGDLKLLHAVFTRASAITQAFLQAVPHYVKLTTQCFMEHEALASVSRMLSDKWWLGRLRRHAAEWSEHLQIALSNVSKKTSVYASKATVSEWKEQKRRTREFLKSMELIDEEGNRVSLIDKYWGSVANPAIRRTELMVRIRGFENICTELGYVGEFYTITAPSKYHATTIHGHRNRKWNGSNPADTQRYLRSVWEKIRAKLHRENLRIFGIRVAEPHHDGTPHWHMLLFMRPEDVEAIREVLRSYACSEDEAELLTAKARKARFHAEPIDPAKGSATGYVAKYISKNIDGYAMDDELDDESDLPMKLAAMAAAAWSSRWHIRQFQFVGGAPVTVYRELRRMNDRETAMGLSVEFAAVHDAADAGDWAGYVNAQGGPFVRRDELVARTWYEVTEEVNAYGEEIIRIKGLFSSEVGKGTPILTRVKQWKIVPALAADKAAAVSGVSAAPRSSVNNCTGRAHGIDDNTDSGVAERLITELKARGFGMWGSSNGLRSPDFDTQSLRETAELLLRGCRFNAGSGMSLHLQNGRLVETENFT